MPRLDLTLPATPHSYPILIEPQLLQRAGALVKDALPKAARALVVSDAEVFPRYGAAVMQSLAREGLQAVEHVLDSGETSKTMTNARAIYEKALSIGLSRKDVIIALGGGVMGDLAGFCAATYYRGTGFVQLPTTLLAQVDSSVGGKVAVNFADVKNGVGVFYQPHLVLADTDTLKSLPAREWTAGLAEVVKYAFLERACRTDYRSTEDSSFFELLEGCADDIQPVLGNIIARCCAMKADIVAQDETESSGTRMVLNLGHTFAHAYEAITHYSTYRHGEAVAIGMARAIELAQLHGQLSDADASAMLSLMQRLKLPTQPFEAHEAATLLNLMRKDKKAEGGTIRLVLPQSPIGKVVTTDLVEESAILQVLQAR